MHGRIEDILVLRDHLKYGEFWPGHLQDILQHLGSSKVTMSIDQLLQNYFSSFCSINNGFFAFTATSSFLDRLRYRLCSWCELYLYGLARVR